MSYDALRMGLRSGTQWIRALTRRLAKLNVILDLGSQDAAAILEAQGAEAVAICDDNGATLLFRDREPAASAVLEELAHVLQYVRGDFADVRDEQEAIHHREIVVKECLLANEVHFPAPENAATRDQLEWHRGMLRRLQERW